MQDAKEKAKLIQLCLFDIDGVLTSGQIYYGSDQHHLIRAFHIHDGLGIKLLQKAGLQIGIISAKRSPSVENRLQDLNITHVYLGYEDKLPAYEDIKQKLQLKDEQIAYMGDDLPDLPLLRRAGLAFTVPAAPDIIKQHSDYITRKKGGKGAVREVSEWLLTVQGHYSSVIQSYLIK
jgi:3-deoxy-D-manno-octulosonate 8-phosphate phosphatase (KDO 8-P phosphatase)